MTDNAWSVLWKQQGREASDLTQVSLQKDRQSNVTIKDVIFSRSRRRGSTNLARIFVWTEYTINGH
jgi:hypothetical protein